MEPEGFPPIDYEGARRALEACGARLECASCDGTVWRNLGDLGNVTVFLTAVNSEGQALRIGTTQAGLSTIAMICANCGFVRLHTVDDLTDRLNESQEDDT